MPCCGQNGVAVAPWIHPPAALTLKCLGRTENYSAEAILLSKKFLSALCYKMYKLWDMSLTIGVYVRLNQFGDWFLSCTSSIHSFSKKQSGEGGGRSDHALGTASHPLDVSWPTFRSPLFIPGLHKLLLIFTCVGIRPLRTPGVVSEALVCAFGVQKWGLNGG